MRASTGCSASTRSTMSRTCATCLSEMGRVLRPGGIAGFSEPGPNHSRDPQSQHEMRRYGVPERDLVIEDVWALGRRSGVLRFVAWRCSHRRRSGSRSDLRRLSRRRLATAMPPATGSPVAARLANRATHALRPRGKARIDQVLLPLQRASRLAVELQRSSVRARRLWHRSRTCVGSWPTAGCSSCARRAWRSSTAARRRASRRGSRSRDISIETGPSETRVSRPGARSRNTGRNRWLPSSAGRGAVLLGLRLRARPAPERGSRPGGASGRQDTRARRKRHGRLRDGDRHTVAAAATRDARARSRLGRDQLVRRGARPPDRRRDPAFRWLPATESGQLTVAN